MTKQIEGVSEKILACAKAEFLEKGFGEASLRTIASKAGTTTGSIYSRFGGKEGLFAAIVEPTADHILRRFEEIQSDFHAMDETVQPEKMETTVSAGMAEIIDYMYEHFDEMQLLVDSSYGTRYQNFIEEMIRIETEYTYKYMDVIKLPAKSRELISEEFVHIMVTSLFESFFEIIRHRMSKENALKYADMLRKYHAAGWNTIFSSAF